MSNPATLTNAMDLSAIESGTQGSSSLSVQQRDFARAYVLNGGNGTKAAVEAGYSESAPATAAYRCLLNSKVLAEIKRLMVLNVSSLLPLAIRTLLEIMVDPETPAKDRIAAANSLLDRGGMAAPKGGVQVNVGVQVNGGEAQALIGSIWEARSKRIASSDGVRSVIDDPMNASTDADEQPMLDHDPTAFGMPINAASDQTPGGVSSQRVPSPVAIHTSPSRSPIANPVEIGDEAFQPEENDDDRTYAEPNTRIDSSRVDVAGSRSVVSSAGLGDDAGSASEEANAASVWRSVAGSVGSGGRSEPVGPDRDDAQRAEGLVGRSGGRTFDYD